MRAFKLRTTFSWFVSKSIQIVDISFTRDLQLKFTVGMSRTVEPFTELSNVLIDDHFGHHVRVHFVTSSVVFTSRGSVRTPSVARG